MSGSIFKKAKTKEMLLEKAREGLTIKLLRVKDESMRLELWKTGHAIDEALKIHGWELAEIEEKKK